MLIFTNTVINFLLLELTRKTLHTSSRTYRVVLSSFIGSLSTLLVFSSRYGEILSFAVKFGVCVVMVLLAFSFKNRRFFIQHVTMLFVLSVLFCGLMIAVFQVFKPKNMMIINDVVYFHINPLVMLAAAAAIYLCALFIRKLFSEKVKNTIVNLTVKIEGKEYTCLGKIDTACDAKEPFSGSPVIIAEKSVIDTAPFPLKRVVPYRTIDGTSIMYAVKADTVEIDRKPVGKEVYVCTKEKIADDFKAVINAEIAGSLE